MNLQRLPLCIAIACSGFVSSHAQTTVATDPVGFVTTTIKASTSPGVPAITPLSPVLLAASAVTGSTIGQLSSVSASGLTVDSAGWTVSQLVSSQAYVLFKSGALNGLILRVTANTETSATLDTFGANLVTLGATAGDSFQLVQGDTLISMFDDGNNDGVPDGVVGGTQAQFQAAQTDRVTTRDASGTVRTYYFNTDSKTWRRLGSGANQGTLPIAPTSGVVYSRIGNTPISLVTTGNVPVSAVKFLVPTSGQTYFARYFPTDGTINSYGFQNLPGWKGTNNGFTVSQADKVVTTDASGLIRQYYWTGSQWRRQGSGSDQSSVSVPIGGSVSVIRTGSGEPQLLNFNIPYTL